MVDDDLKRVSREEAIALCLKFYLPLEPCVRGHLSKRRTNNNQCTECLSIHKAKFRNLNRKRLREEHRKWSRANRDHINDYKKKRWAQKNEINQKLRNEEKRNRIAARDAAIANGSKYYFDGRPCNSGHIAGRYVSTGHCVECGRERCSQYAESHREQCRNRQRRNYKKRSVLGTDWRQRNRERVRTKERARYAINPQKHINKVKDYYQVNKERIKAERKQEYYAYEQNDPIFRAKAAKRVRKWAAANPERVKTNAAKSRIRRKRLELDALGTFTAADVRAILKAQRHRCAYCKKSIKKNYVMDHIIPLARSGTNDRKNMQATCAPCNLRKHARDPLDFARSLGMLL